MDLVKELKQQREASAKNAEAIVDSARLLINADAQRERAILGDLGLDRNIKQLEDIKGAELEIAELTEKFGNTFKLEEIKAIALRYGLKLRPSSEYQGEIDVELASQTRRFLESRGQEMNSYIIKNNFYILAPVESFKIVSKPKPKPIPVDMADPILFYRDDNNTDYYTMVYKWGKDFTWSRLIIGFYTRNETNKFYTALLFTIMMFSISVLGFKSILEFSGFSLAFSSFTVSLISMLAFSTNKYAKITNEKSFNSKWSDE